MGKYPGWLLKNTPSGFFQHISTSAPRRRLLRSLTKWLVFNNPFRRPLRGTRRSLLKFPLREEFQQAPSTSCASSLGSGAEVLLLAPPPRSGSPCLSPKYFAGGVWLGLCGGAKLPSPWRERVAAGRVRGDVPAARREDACGFGPPHIQYLFPKFRSMRVRRRLPGVAAHRMRTGPTRVFGKEPCSWRRHIRSA